MRIVRFFLTILFAAPAVGALVLIVALIVKTFAAAV